MNLLRLIQINKNKIQFKYLIIALLIWYSIGAKFSDIYIFELTLASLANFFKSLINILFPLTIFVIIFYKKYFINFLKSEYLFLILYFIIQIFYIFNNPNLNELLLNIFIPEKILSLSNEILIVVNDFFFYTTKNACCQVRPMRNMINHYDPFIA